MKSKSLFCLCIVFPTFETFHIKCVLCTEHIALDRIFKGNSCHYFSCKTLFPVRMFEKNYFFIGKNWAFSKMFTLTGYIDLDSKKFETNPCHYFSYSWVTVTVFFSTHFFTIRYFSIKKRNVSHVYYVSEFDSNPYH